MANMLFDSINGGVSSLDNQSVLTVHSLLDHQILPQNEADDNDVFLCGKCKKQFTSITVFMSHKKECCTISHNGGTNYSISNEASSISPNTVVVRKIEVAAASNYPQNVVLTEADLLSLTTSGLDNNLATTLSACPSIQITPGNSLTSNHNDSIQTVNATIHHVLPQLSSISASQQEHSIVEQQQQPHTFELSFLNNKLVSSPIILSSEPTNSSSLSSVVFNISSMPAEKTSPLTATSHSVLLPSNNVENEAENFNSVQTEACISQNSNEKEPNTVNIITEFHSSMVRTKKKLDNGEKEGDTNKKGNKLNCAYCMKSFSKNFDLQQHIRCHTGEKPFQCIVCGRAFAQKSNVKKHMQSHKVWPDGLSHTLPQSSSKGFSSSSEDGDNTSDNIHSTQTVDRNIDNRLLSEVGKELTENSYACPYCQCVAKTYFKLKSHMKQHKKEKVYKCILNTCGSMFQELDPFLEHVKTHENEMTYHCIECNKNFSSLYELGTHQFTHSLYPNQRSRSARRYFRCTYCLNKYSTPAALDHHMATSTHVYSCCHCNKIFPCERYLRRHLHIHADAETFVCKLCSKGFKTENYLKIHMLIHSDSKPFQCNVCKAAFNRRDKLKRHLLVHESVKKLKCPFRTHSGCPKEFNRPDKLKAHILTHSCIKPFVCKMCGRNFTRRAHLREHVKLHNENKLLYICKVCGQNFNDSRELEDHHCSGKVSLKKQNSRKYWSLKHRKHRHIGNSDPLTFSSGMKKRGRPRKLSRPKEVVNDAPDEISEVADDIPTAHIEIISTSGELLANNDLTHIAIPSDINVSDVYIQPIITESMIACHVNEPHHSNLSNFTVSTVNVPTENINVCSP